MSLFVRRSLGRFLVPILLLTSIAAVGNLDTLFAQPEAPAAVGQAPEPRSEADLVLPDLGSVEFSGINGRTLLMGGLVICALGLLFGLTVFTQLKNLPVHASMLEVSELIYETCKTYLITQGKFCLLYTSPSPRD